MLCFRPHSKAAKEDSRVHYDSDNAIQNEEKFSWSDFDEGDFYKLYHLDECLINITSKGFKIRDKRRNVIDWLIHTHYQLELVLETLYLCVNILDRFLFKTNFVANTEKEFQLIGVTSLLLASKYEQQKALSVYQLEAITHNHCSKKDISDMEKVILQKLDWVFRVPTPYVFLLRNIRACSLSNEKEEHKIMENMMFFLSELSLTHYPIVYGFKPSVIAASAIYLARIIVGRNPFWSKTLEICTGYSEEKLRTCAKVMMDYCGVTCREGKMGVFRKFLSPNYSKVACVAQQEFHKNASELRNRLNLDVLLEKH